MTMEDTFCNQERCVCGWCGRPDLEYDPMTDQMTPEESAVKEFEEAFDITREEKNYLLELLRDERTQAATEERDKILNGGEIFTKAELEFATESQRKEIQDLKEKNAGLEEFASFGLKCYQDRCEGALVEQSVLDRRVAEAIAERDKAIQKAYILRQSLKSVEFGNKRVVDFRGSISEVHYCPECNARSTAGHKSFCGIQKALTATEADVAEWLESVKRQAFHEGFQAAIKAGVEGPFNLVSQWQPIETAPKDEDIFIFSGNGKFVAHKRDEKADSGWFIRGWDGCMEAYSQATALEPTHWMPLPQPPQVEGGQGG